MLCNFRENGNVSDEFYIGGDSFREKFFVGKKFWDMFIKCCKCNELWIVIIWL